MPIQDTITQAQEEFVESYESAISTFVDDSQKLEEESVDPMVVLGGLIVADYWLQDLLMEQAVSKYLFRIDSVLDDLALFGTIRESELQAFRVAHERLIGNYTLSLGDKVHLEIMRGISSGLSATDIKGLIERNYFLRSTSVSTFVKTQIADYANMVTQTMAQGMPENTKYTFINPLDEETRHLCVKMISYGKMTKKQIESNFPGAFFDRGGPNCRGYWEISKNVKNDNVNEAKKSYKGLQDRYKSKNRPLNIKTQKQYYESRKNG